MGDAYVLLHILHFFSGFCIGICLGSFATALIWRIPRKIPWIYDKKDAVRSMCPSCNTTLEPIDLVPLFSWLCFRGKCRHCKRPVSLIYPLTEAICGIICGFIFFQWGFTVESFLIASILLFAGVFFWVGLRKKFWSGTVFAITVSLMLGLIVILKF